MKSSRTLTSPRGKRATTSPSIRKSIRVAEVETAVAGLRSLSKDPGRYGDPETRRGRRSARDDENVLIIKQNIDGVEHQLSHPRRPVLTNRELPIASLALTRPKPHQTKALNG